MEYIKLQVRVMVLFACCFLVTLTHGDDSECDLPLLNGPMYKVINPYFKASGTRADSFHFPDQVVFNRMGWCANEQGFNVYDRPMLAVEFGAEVRVTKVMIGAVNSNTYIERFRVQGCDIMSNKTCSLVNNTEMPLNTSLSTENTTSCLHLLSPVTGRVIRILPVEWQSHSPCLYLELYGCLNNPVCSNISELNFNVSQSETNNSTDLMFQSPVVITSLVFESENNLRNINFTNESDTYQDFTGREVFNASGVFTFWSPRLYVNEMLTIAGDLTNSSVMTVFGCNQSDIIIRSSTMSCILPSKTLPPSPTVIIKREYLILEAGVPLASLTVGIIALLVICCIIHTYNIKRQTRRKLKKLKEENGSLGFEESKETTLKRVDNELYSPPVMDDTSNSIPYAAFVEPPQERALLKLDPSVDKNLEDGRMSKTYESLH